MRPKAREARKDPKVQMLTAKDLFDGKRPPMPLVDPSVFRKAKRENTERQNELEL